MNIKTLNKISKERYVNYFHAKYLEALTNKDKSAQVYYKYQIDKEIEYLNSKSNYCPAV